MTRMKLLTGLGGGNGQLVLVEWLKLVNFTCLLWHVVVWEVSEGRVLSSWQMFVVGCLEWLTSCLGKNLFKVILDDEAGSVVHLGLHF